jgi:hypothetical protein
MQSVNLFKSCVFHINDHKGGSLLNDVFSQAVAGSLDPDRIKLILQQSNQAQGDSGVFLKKDYAGGVHISL